jgi:hypothetical protein
VPVIAHLGQRRSDPADAMFREMKRGIAAALRP